MGAWQVKGKNRRQTGDSGTLNTKVEDNKFGSSKGKSNSESNSSGRDADEVSSGGQPSAPQRQGYGSSLAETISSIMGRFTLQPAEPTQSESAGQAGESTAEATGPSSQANDAPKNEGSS